MGSYWLTPVIMAGNEVSLLEDRIRLEPADAAAEFMRGLKQVSPRMLIAFKASLLLSEEAEAACGVEQLPFRLSSGERISFGPDALELSHCAQAYLDRLPAPKEWQAWMDEAESVLQTNQADPIAIQWLYTVKSWADQGLGVTLLREDE